jgi:hypothetical protein
MTPRPAQAVRVTFGISSRGASDVMRLCTMGVWQVGSSTKCQCFRTMTQPRWWNAVTRNRPDTEPQERDSLIDLQNTPFFGKLGDWMG